MHSIEKVKKFEKVQDVCEKEFSLFSTDLKICLINVWLNFKRAIIRNIVCKSRTTYTLLTMPLSS